MIQEDWEVEFYIKPNSRCPTQDFLDKQSAKDVAYIFNNGFDRLEEFGRNLERPYVAHLEKQIYELRVLTNRVRYRFLFFIVNGYKFIITHGFKKKFGKIPQSEIKKAIEYKKEYLSR